MNQTTVVTANPGNRALMLSQGQLAGHFSRAEVLQILSPTGEILATQPNPATTTGCAGKKELLEALTRHGVEQVIVHNIGERMLARLLAANIRVMQCRSARLPLPELLAPANLQPLTEASQGRPSRRHQNKSAIRAIQPVGTGHSHTHCHGGCNSSSDHCCASGGNQVDSPRQGHTCCHGSEGANQQGGCCHHH
ncbi:MULTISPECIES: NifB/NifX family molybdenum-iron cluster-binding protein [Aeromonas]|uniref:NifB/NifX family molybdenum-iron cluster-binding protein n=1 Tax=Aeromonas TaxID=642 RepID=UPI002B05C8DA|nr:NifB/NifX family molybdenum-iron cluster-binding protein [Aeromonas jandaei]